MAIKQIRVADQVVNLVRVTDITPKKRIEEERKQAEIALKQSEIRYRAIVEDQTELIARYLPDGTLTFVNQAYAVYFGRSPEELIGSTYQPIIFEADRERVVQLIPSMSVDNPVITIENRVVVADGVRWTQWHKRMLFDER
ncbi:PAS domain-containing protein [Nostoc sp.]|uniref:PAS domain-containing protein n=1 Tax=Nostoc sp. TaxID=1180 RepID=UPI002FF4ACC5